MVKYIRRRRLAVMYPGKIVEIARTADIFDNPRHPCTYALLSGIPVPDPSHISRRIVLSGDVPSPVTPASACRFHTRCPFAIDVCRRFGPLLEPVGDGHRAACHRKHEAAQLI